MEFVRVRCESFPHLRSTCCIMCVTANNSKQLTKEKQFHSSVKEQHNDLSPPLSLNQLLLFHEIYVRKLVKELLHLTCCCLCDLWPAVVTKYNGKVMFSLCQSVHRWGGGAQVSGLSFLSWSLVPCHFLGWVIPQSLVQGPFWGKGVGKLEGVDEGEVPEDKAGFGYPSSPPPTCHSPS